MIDPVLLAKGQEMGIIHVDESIDKVTYRLGVERQYQWSDPEEQVRTEYILDLIFNYSYSPQRIKTEESIPGRTPTNWADVVVFKDDRLRDPYITIELAAPTATQRIREQKTSQLFGYANALSSEYGVYYDSTTKLCWRVRGFGGLERVQNRIGDIPKNYGENPTYVFYRGGERDLEVIQSNTLSRIFDQCHNDLWSGGRFDPTEAFDEMSKLIFAKLFDEQHTSNGEPYKFQWGDRQSDIMVADRVTSCYEEARSRDMGVFSEGIRSDPHKLASVVRRLQHVSLYRTDPDAKGRAYEQFLGEVFRGRLGQYFTRREIVDFLVGITKPTLNDIILDPACGSGGFLVHSMKHVFQTIEADFSGDENTIFRHKENFAKNSIYGVEINEKIARVAMMDMVINDDGHTNIVVRSALDSDFSNQGINDNSFSLVLTNPPFGNKVKSDDRDKLGQSELEEFELSSGKKTAKSENLFIERCTRFLREGGCLGIVVPDGVLSNPSDQHVREYLLENFHVQAIVSLPSFAFRMSGSGMSTSLVIARKWQSGEYRDQDYHLFMAIADHIGFDATARPDTNELPKILSHFENNTGSIEDKVMRVPRSEMSDRRRLDPLYYYLGPIIEQEFEEVSYPTHTLHEIAGDSIQSGKAPPGGAKYSVGEVPIVLVGNISPDGTLDMEDACFVDDVFFEENRAKASIAPYDILVAKDGATTGKVGLVPVDFEYEQCLINEHIFRFRIGAMLPGDVDSISDEETEELFHLNTRYVFFFLKSWLGQNQIFREISGGAQGGITKEFVKKIRIPVMPIDDRKLYVEKSQIEYDKYLTLATQVREQLEQFNDSLGLRV